MPTTEQPSQYEVDRVNRSRQARANAARSAQRSAFCRDRDKAMHLGNRTVELQSNVDAYDNPGTGLRTEIRAARKWLGWFIFLGFAVLLIANADFWLGMPDVSEQLANKATSIIAQVRGILDGTDATDQVEGDRATPVALRVGCGIIVVLMWLSLTLGWKACTDTSELRNSVEALVPGDDESFRRIQRSIWVRRLGRIAYMGILAGLLSYLYTFDLQKARELVALRQIEDSTINEIQWPDFGVGITNGELETDEAIPQSDPSVAQSEPIDPEQAAHNLARPQVLIYTLLLCLHGLLMVIPTGERPDDLSLAIFDRGRAGRKARGIREQEETLLLDLHTRIREADPELRDELLIEAMPVAKRINETLGWTALEEPVSPGQAPVSLPSSVVDDAPAIAGDKLDLEQNRFREQFPEVPATGRQSDRQSDHQAPMHGRGDDEDPLAAIFG